MRALLACTATALLLFLSPGVGLADHHEGTEKAESCAAKSPCEKSETASSSEAGAPEKSCASKKQTADENLRAAEEKTAVPSEGSL
jgi:hypothetical protein